jgi:hypothetical protein
MPYLKSIPTAFLPWLRLARLLVLAAGLCAAVGAQARGFLWEARKGDAKVLLMGTVHVGKKGESDLTDAHRAAVESAEVIALEAVVANDARTLAAFRAEAFYADDRFGLRDAVPPAQLARALKLGARFGLLADGVLRMKPWAVANQLVMLEAQRLGFSPAASTEAQLQALAAASGKRIVEIEGLERQLAFFNAAPPEVQVAYLQQAVESIETGAGEKEIRALLGAWMAGDGPALARRLAQMRQADNVAERWINEQMIDARHPGMVATIERYAASGSLHLVAVGSLHLFGERGLIQLLRQKGFSVRPLD